MPGVPAVNFTTTLVAESGAKAKAGANVSIQGADFIRQC